MNKILTCCFGKRNLEPTVNNSKYIVIRSQVLDCCSLWIYNIDKHNIPFGNIKLLFDIEYIKEHYWKNSILTAIVPITYQFYTILYDKISF